MKLIDADKLKEKLSECANEVADASGFFEGIKMGYLSAIYWVEKAPAVEGEDQQQGVTIMAGESNE